MFSSVDHATIEAWRAACDMSIDSLRSGRSRPDYRFEVCDNAGHLIFELPFSDLAGIRPERPAGSDSPVQASLHRRMATTQTLQAEVLAAVIDVRSTLATTRALLDAD